MTDFCTECICHENSSNQTSELIVTLPTSTMIIPFTDGIDYGGKKSCLNHSEKRGRVTPPLVGVFGTQSRNIAPIGLKLSPYVRTDVR